MALDGIFEFQTAYAYTEEKMSDYIKIISNKLNNICDFKAPRIPILPEVVDQAFVSDYLGSLTNIPIGVEKESLDISTLNLRDNFMYIITGDDISSDSQFYLGLINNILATNNTECIVFDTNSLLHRITNERVVYAKDICTEAIESLKQAYSKNDPEKTTVCFLFNINSFLSKMNSVEKTKFTDEFNAYKENGNIKFIIIDTIDAIKSINYESWFKSNVDLGEGIWIGNGIGNQFTLKITTNSRLLRAEVSPGFGYSIKKGKASLIKLMSDE